MSGGLTSKEGEHAAAEDGGLIATTSAQLNARQIEPQHMANYVALIETVLEHGRY